MLNKEKQGQEIVGKQSLNTEVKEGDK